MPRADLGDVTLAYAETGDPQGPPLVLLHGLGMDHRLWDEVLPHLPPGLRLIRPDLRGHGASDAPMQAASMGALVRDAERLLDHLGVTDALLLGHGLGGMVAQGLAVKRLDLVRALGLAMTAAKLETKALWQARARSLRERGLAPLEAELRDRWTTRAFRAAPGMETARAILADQPAHGLAACCEAIAGSDFYTPTSGLRLPTLALAASDDRVTPADLVRETAALIPGARLALIRRSGHLAPLEQPQAFAAELTHFLHDTGHL